MRATESLTAHRQGIKDWFSTPLGRSLQTMELNRLREILPHLYGPIAVQVGRIGTLNMLDASDAATKVVLDPGNGQEGSGSVVRAQLESLPFDAKSVGLVLLPHTLQLTSHPHHLLREVSRVLVPEGHVVVVGFNPISLWGLGRLLLGWTERPPWNAHFYRLARIKDWLQLLDFECVGGSMLYYRPAVRNEALRDRLFFLERAGDRWWPMMAAVYFVVARKREIGLTPITPAWSKRKRLAPGLPA